MIIMANNLVYLGLGSNIGNLKQNLRTAQKEIDKIGKIIKKSSLYKTEPVNYRNQAEFLNMVLALKTVLSPLELIVQLQKIEHKMGRIKEIDKGPRLIDIDILYYNNEIIDQPNLQIPHPQITKRNFILIPMNEIASKHKDPKYKKIIKELLQNSKNSEKVTLWT